MKTSFTQRYKIKTLVLSMAAASAMLPMYGYAADAVEEIQITGSRVRVTDGMATPTPVTAITTGELSNFDPGGTVAEQLDSLPQFFNTQTAQRGGGALFGSAGGSFLNMRNLGAQRTLVLIDGMRVVPGDKSGSVNVDTLPTALLKNVDVVTGGASAAYGADAIGGVTNFVLDRRFQGLKVSVGTGVGENGEGARYNFSVAGGRKFGEKLNVIGSLEARHIDQIELSERDMDSSFFKRYGYVHNPAYKATDPAGTNPQYLIRPWVTSSTQSPYGFIASANIGPALTSPSAVAAAAPAAAFNASGLLNMKFNSTGTGIEPFVKGDYYTSTGQANMSGGPEADLHNRAFATGANGFEVEGRSGFIGGEYLLSDKVTLFGQAMLGRSESKFAGNRAIYEMESPWSVTVFRDNAYLPSSVASIMDANNFTALQVNKNGAFLGKPEVGSGQRDHNVLTTQSWAAGFDADLNGNWALRGTWQTGESERKSQVYNKLRADRMYLAADAVRDPASGKIVCRVTLRNPSPAELAASPSLKGLLTDRLPVKPLYSPIGLDAETIKGCVPYNVMGSGNISPEAVEYVGTDRFGIGNVDQDFAELLLTGKVFDGWGYGPVSLAAGVTYRKQSFTDGATPADLDELGPPRNDPALGIQGIPAGIANTGSPNLYQFSTVPLISGDYNVKEVFGELEAPIWASASGNQRLGGSLAFRQSDYSTSGKVESWKVGLDFQVFKDLRLRATKSRDVREATFSERFDAQGGGGTAADPTRNRQIVQITTVVVGNPDLKPEYADTDVIGLVYEPSFVDGLQVSTDFYNVDVQDAIGSLGIQRIVDDCYTTSPELCKYVERDSLGAIGRVFNPFLNVASAIVTGVDTEVAYKFEPDFFGGESESFSLRALYGHIIERSNVSTTGAASVRSEGGIGSPKNTLTVTANYRVGNWSGQLQSRWIDGVRLSKVGSTGLAFTGVDFDDATVPSNAWVNAQLSYSGETKGGANWVVGLAVQNLFDRNPPIIPSFGTRGGSQTVSDTYDAEGRRYQLSLNYNF